MGIDSSPPEIFFSNEPLLPVDPNGDPVYGTFKKQMEALSKHQPHDETENSRLNRRMAVEQFVRSRTGKTDAMPWLEERLNPPPLDLPPCYIRPLPENFKPHTFDDLAKIALVPWAPPLEYWENPPEKQFSAKNEFDEHILKIFYWQGIDSMQTLPKEYARTAFREEYPRDPLDTEKIYATWAKDTAIDGVDVQRNIAHSRRLNGILHGERYFNSICSFEGQEAGRLYLPMPLDLKMAASQSHNSLEQLHQGIAAYIDNKNTHPIPNYEERSAELFTNFRDIIDCCRWHLEHQNVGDSDTTNIITETLIEAYRGLNTVIQTCNKGDAKAREIFTTSHDLSILIAGVKIDHPSRSYKAPNGKMRGHYGDEAQFNLSTDYFDAFMAVAQSHTVAQEYGKTVMQRESFHWHDHEGGRSLFGDFESSLNVTRQQLTMMAVLCLRMPEWQQKTYAGIIYEQFSQLRNDLSIAISEEPLLFISSQQEGSVGNPELYPYDFADFQDTVRSNYLEPLYALVSNQDSLKDTVGRQDGRLEVTLSPATLDSCFGLGADGLWTDQHGFVRTKFESPPPVELVVATEAHKSWLERLQEIPTLLAESRVGRETARVIDKLLKEDRETGSIKTVSTFAATLERLLGRKPAVEEADFVSLLEELSLINTSSLKLNSLDQEDITEVLENIRSGKAELSDLDDGSLVILMMLTTGEIPRELLVELVLKTYESLGSVLTLEAILALEKLEDKRHRLPFAKKDFKPGQTLTDRRTLQEYLAAKREAAVAANTEYNPQADLDFRTRANATIHRISILLHHNYHYDSSMKSSLVAAIAAKEQGQSAGRCHVHGQMLTAIAQFVGGPELTTYYTRTYGAEELLPLDKWYEHLTRASESGAESHAYNQTNWLDGDGLTSIQVTDATGQLFYSLSPDDLEWPTAKNAALSEHGQATNQTSPHIYRRTRMALGECVTGGSEILGDLALEARQPLYAEMANPDSPIYLLYAIADDTFPKAKRVAALTKLLTIQPHRLGMAIRADYDRGHTAERLEETISLSLQTHHWGGAFVATNILKAAKFFGGNIRTEAGVMYHHLTRSMATQSQADFDQSLADHGQFLTEADRAAIHQERTAYLEALEAKIQAQQEKDRAEVERTHQTEVLAALQPQIEATKESLQADTFQLKIQEVAQERDSQATTPTLGYQATKKVKQEIKARERDLTEKTLAPPPETTDRQLFESVNEKTSTRALERILTGPDGKQVTGDEATRRLRLVQAAIINVALGMASKSDLNAAELEDHVETLALHLHRGLEATAKTNNISLPTFTPRGSLPAATPKLFLSQPYAGGDD